jgi:hypothetical protein
VFKDKVNHTHIMTFYLPESMGWGNVALCLSDLVYRSANPRAYKSLLDVDRGVEFHGFEITSDPNEEKFKPQIVINPPYFHRVHSNLNKIIKPTKELQEIIDKHIQWLPHGLSVGIHIRRGACSQDSKDIGCHGKDENGNIKPAYFAKDSAIEKFIKIVEDTPGKIFLASDSQEIKDIFKKRFPDKIVTLEHDIVLTYKCDTLKNYDVTREQRLACYVDWFLLSKCKELYITAGNQDLTDLSTFGYSAGAYGRSNVHFVFN